ncbi:MAG TPA: YihY/virulence factor BrkB family protein [Pyrinomonadaceae bacterium]|jgi:membrane protein|nr:YihY/virulence factor BrkB family protein [Pyrinomonadaceae bacterium]
MTKHFDWTLFFTRLYKRSFDEDVFSRAAQVAFYFSFAVFPLLYFLVSLFGMLLESSDGLKNELFSYLRQFMPYAVFDLIRTTIDEIIDKSSGGKLTIGLLATLWSASAGIDAIRTALNDIYNLRETRSWIRTKLQSLFFTFLITALAGVVLAIVFYGLQLLKIGFDRVGLDVNSNWILIPLQWTSMLLVTLFACAIIYNALPAFKKHRWKLISPGSIVAIASWILLTTAFRTYLGYFNSYNKAYGSLGAVIIMMLWLYLTALALMIGGVINSVLAQIREGKEKDEQIEQPT